MKWFAVNCIYQVICGEGKHAPQFNEQIRLIFSNSVIEAIAKVKLMAFSYNASFKNYEGESVKWNFIAVGGVTEIEPPKDGVEVSSKILEPKSVEYYLENVEHKNKILTKKTNKF